MTRRRTPSRHWLLPLGLMFLLGGLALPALVVHAATTWHVTSCADDGGAATLGCAVEIVTPLPTTQRPHALLDALAKHGL